MSDVPMADHPATAEEALDLNLWKTALGISDIRAMCKKAHGPDLSDSDATTIAIAFNRARFLAPARVSSPKPKRGERTNLDRWRSIASALKVLKAELPVVLADQRRVKPQGDLSCTEGLLLAVNNHQVVIDEFGQPREHPKGAAKLLGNELRAGAASIWGRYGKVREGCLDEFVKFGVEWILDTQAPKSETIGRNRRPDRTK